MEEDEFKDTEIGRIPKDWNVEKLIKHVDLIRGKEVGSNNYNNDNKGKRFIRIADLSGSKDDILYTTSNNVIECNKDDILISFDGSPGIVATNFFGAISSGIRKIYFKDNSLNKKYTYYFLQTIYIQNIIKKFSTGVTIKHASKAIPNLIIIIPPLEEQKRIAYVLSKIENAIKIQDRIINSLQELKKSMMHKLFTEGIGHTEFKDTEIGRIPKEWEIKKISELFSIEHGISITPKRRKLRANYPMLRTSNIGWGKISLEKIDYSWFSDDEIKNLNLQYGDLLVCEGGDIGRTAMWTGELEKVGYQNHLHRLRKKYDSVSPLFYMYWMQYAILYSHLYINEGNKTTIPNLSKSKIMNFNVVYTTYEEQKRIADILSAIDNKISIEEKRKDLFENLFKSMLNKLMTGQIRVKNLEMREID